MKRVVLLTASMIFLLSSVSMAQVANTSAPDQGTDQTNVAQTNALKTRVTNAIDVLTNDTTPVAETNVVEATNASAQEKEVVVAEGVVYNDGKIDYASADVKYLINAVDAGAGVKAVYVQLDDSAMGLYTEALTVRTEGKHLIAYKVEDQVGNISPVKNYEFVMDATAPTVLLNTDQKTVKIGDVVYLSSNYNFVLTANDKLSGVKSIEVALDEAELQTYTNVVSANAEEDGMHKVYFQATDQVGNVSEKQEFQYFLDLTAPSVDISADPVVFEKEGKNYVSPMTDIKVSAKDNDTGVAKVLVAVDDGEFSEYDFPIHLTVGSHTVKVKAVDLVGNMSAEKSMTFEVDGDSPEGEVVPNK